MCVLIADADVAGAIARLADLVAAKPGFSSLRVIESLIGTLVGAFIGFWSGLFFRKLQLRREQRIACMKVAITLQRQATDFINTKTHIQREKAARLMESPGAPLWLQYRLLDQFSDASVAQDASALATCMTGKTGSKAMNALLETDMKYRLSAALHGRVNDLRSAFNEYLEGVVIAAGGDYHEGVPGALIEEHIHRIPARIRFEYESQIANLFFRFENDQLFYENAIGLFNEHAKTLEPRRWLLGPRGTPVSVALLAPEKTESAASLAAPRSSFAPSSFYRT